MRKNCIHSEFCSGVQFFGRPLLSVLPPTYMVVVSGCGQVTHGSYGNKYDELK